jgi:hypothetical protein
MAAVGAVLLLILKILGWMLLAAAVLILIALFVPASVWLDYTGGELRIWAGMLFVRVPVYPGKEKTPEQQARQERKKAEKQAKKQEKKARKHGAGRRGHVAGETLRLSLDQICAAAGGAGRFARAALGAMRVRHIRIVLPVTGDDAADTAVRFGKTNAWLHTCLALLNRVLWLDFTECRVEPDFTGKQAESEHFSCQISAQLFIMVAAAIRLILLLKDKRILDAFL